MRARRALAAGVAALALAIAGCGGGGDSDEGSSGDSKGSSGGSQATNWPLFGRIPSRTHYLAGDHLDPPLKQVWEFEMPTLLEFPPVLVGERLFVADKSGEIVALDTANGKVLWRHRRPGSSKGKQPADVTSPTYADGLVIVALEAGEVVALDPAEGKPAWTTKLPTTLQSSPLVIDGQVYVGSDDGTLWALDLKDGNPKAVIKARRAIKASPAYDGGTLYVGDYAGNMYGVDADKGEISWSTDTTESPAGGSGGFFSSPAIAGGRVYAGRDDGTVFAFDADDGKYAWSYDTGGAVYGSPAAAPGPGGDLTIFIGSYDARLYALDAETGKVSWSEAVGPVPGSASVVGSTVYSSSFKTGNTVGYDTASHKRVFRFPSPGYSPMISDGVHLFLAGYESVHAFKPR